MFNVDTDYMVHNISTCVVFKERRSPKCKQSAAYISVCLKGFGCICCSILFQSHFPQHHLFKITPTNRDRSARIKKTDKKVDCSSIHTNQYYAIYFLFSSLYQNHLSESVEKK